MTTELQKAFEEYCIQTGRFYGNRYDSPRIDEPDGLAFWNASREHIRAKLQSDKMVNAVADAITEYGNAACSIQGEEYTIAKAAIAAVLEEI